MLSGLRALTYAVVFICLAGTPLFGTSAWELHDQPPYKIGGRVRVQLHVRYVLDMAEIPTYQALREVSPTGTLDPAQLAALWASAVLPGYSRSSVCPSTARPSRSYWTIRTPACGRVLAACRYSI